MRTERVVKFSALLSLLVAILACSLTPICFSQDQQEQPQTKSRKILTKVAPVYPNLAKNMGIGGAVKIEVVVAPNGTVTSTEVLGGHPILAQAGVDALRKTKWNAAAHESKEIIIFNFHP